MNTTCEPLSPAASKRNALGCCCNWASADGARAVISVQPCDDGPTTFDAWCARVPRRSASAAPSTSPTGEVLGETYELIDRLAWPAIAIVYRARENREARVRDSSGQDASSRPVTTSRVGGDLFFEREALANPSATLHPNISRPSHHVWRARSQAVPWSLGCLNRRDAHRAAPRPRKRQPADDPEPPAC